jgi:FKBP-type peptidyl-prolyl cis-trans isomerase
MTPIRYAIITLVTSAISVMLQAQEPTLASFEGTGAASEDAPVVQEEAPAVAEQASTEPSDNYSKEQILEVWGWFLGQQIDLIGLDLNESEIVVLSRGILASSQGREPDVDLEKIAPFVQDYLTARSESIRADRSSVGKSAEEVYFAELEQRPGVIKLGSGLSYEIIEPGSGAYPTPEDVVVVHYTGRLVDGTVFDSSASRGEPTSFQLNQVIPGWAQGLQKISVGGTIKLHIPADLAYGDTGRPGIPPASALVFIVELLEVNMAIPPAEPTEPVPDTP